MTILDDANMKGSSPEDVNLEETIFNDISLKITKLINIDLENLVFDDVYFGNGGDKRFESGWV
ncbi:MAG: hypothetical protein KTR18_08855 [Acidiferrobacterales bacterium]|nr:hypothetical protein [Acidiferrobacterales bacterium]